MPNIDENFKGSALYGNELILEGQHFTKDSFNSMAGLNRMVLEGKVKEIQIPDYNEETMAITVYKDNALQTENTDYTISSTGLITPSSGGNFRVEILYPYNLQQIDLPQSYYSIGDEVIKDGVTSVCVYVADVRQDWGQMLFVDKSHDLSYYITGSDYVNSNDYNTSPGTFGYEWGGYNQNVGGTSQAIGTGLSNTNILISKNLTPNTPGWRVLWDMVEEFRSTHSNDWFVPSLNELSEVYKQRSYLENLSTNTNYYYWTSSEYGSNRAYYVYFTGGNSSYNTKYNHNLRFRLCWAL